MSFLLPLCAQFSSLIFGHIHKSGKRNEKYKLQIPEQVSSLDITYTNNDGTFSESSKFLNMRKFTENNIDLPENFFEPMFITKL